MFISLLALLPMRHHCRYQVGLVSTGEQAGLSQASSSKLAYHCHQNRVMPAFCWQAQLVD